MIRRHYFMISALALAALFLGSCNFGDGDSVKESEKSPSIPELAASAQPWAGPDTLEYYNEAADCSLCLDGKGGFVLYASGMSLRGTYTATESSLSLFGGGEQAMAYPGGGGYVLSGMAGLFLPVEERESFTELGVLRAGDREYTEEAGGSYRLSDYSLQLALRYPDTMSSPENLITDAVVVWDGEKGYVTGRNVTGDFAGEAGSFMDSYMRQQVLPDFRLLYGEEGEFESLEELDEGISGRLASAEGLITGAGERIYVKCIMYTSTYSDGTVNYICKCFFAPEDDSETFNTLANSVVNMTAVRRR